MYIVHPRPFDLMGKCKRLVGEGWWEGGQKNQLSLEQGGGSHIFCQAYGDIRILLSVFKVNLCVREWGCAPPPQ